MERRSSFLALFVVVCGTPACSDVGGTQGESGRDAAVGDEAATGSQPPTIATSPPRSTKLCGLPPPMPGVRPPAVKMGSLHAAGEKELGETLETGGGKWTLISVWSSHCKACLADMPVLKAWEAKLSRQLRVAFVSVDDDQRAAVKILTSQPETGLRRSYHLEDAVSRHIWMSSIGAPMTLPVQVLVDMEGVVQCVAIRAVRATDLPEIEALVSGGQK